MQYDNFDKPHALPLSAVAEPMKTIGSPQSLTNDQLVTIAIGAFTKLRDAYPYLLELRQRFFDAPRGKAAIAGCDTWEQFCAKHLNRSPVTVRQLLEENPASKGGTPATCEYCGEEFPSKTRHKKHINEKHPNHPQQSLTINTLVANLSDNKKDDQLPARQQEVSFPENTGSPQLEQKQAFESKAIQKAVPNTDEYPEVAAGDVVVFQKGKNWYRLTTIDKVTEKQIHFDGRYHVPKTTHRSWNMLLLRLATEKDRATFDDKWRDRMGNLQRRFKEELLDIVENFSEAEARLTLDFIREKFSATPAV